MKVCLRPPRKSDSIRIVAFLLLALCESSGISIFVIFDDYFKNNTNSFLGASIAAAEDVTAAHEAPGSHGCLQVFTEVWEIHIFSV